MQGGCTHVGILCNQLIDGQHSIAVCVNASQDRVERIDLEALFLVRSLSVIEKSFNFLSLDHPVAVHIDLAERCSHKIPRFVVHVGIAHQQLVQRQRTVIVTRDCVQRMALEKRLLVQSLSVIEKSFNFFFFDHPIPVHIDRAERCSH